MSSSGYDSDEESSVEARPEAALPTGSFVRPFTVATKQVFRWYGPVRVPDKDYKVS